MSIHPQPITPVPDETARIARRAFPKGNRYLLWRDEIGLFYTDEDFAGLFSGYGRAAVSPWRLATICILQFMEDLTDRQAAEGVQSRIDWKYLLGLELTDPGFDHSILSEFRERLVSSEAGEKLLDKMLEHLKARGWLKARGKQRTDSTHVLAAIKNLNRLEGIGETLRAALDELATFFPDWLQRWVPVEWFERYGRSLDEYRLPKGIAARQEYAERVGSDGMTLLAIVWDDSSPLSLRGLPFVEYLRKTWVQQFYIDNGRVKLRAASDLPPAGERADSPHDPDARYGNKRSTTWTGYKVHLTETCDEGEVHLITHVITTPGHRSDVDQTEPIHAALKAKSLLPSEHIVDAGYVDTSLVLTSRQRYGVELVGPMRPNGSWQTKQEGAYSLERFAINWKTKRATCPRGKKSKSWTPTKDAWNNAIIYIKFSRTDCRLCPDRSLCTRSPSESRSLTIRPRAEYQALQSARREQQTEDWQTRYSRRAGIEGTISQGVNALGLRRCRYRNLAKTHLQHLLTGSAINILRMVAWLRGQPHAKTRLSPFASLAPTRVG